MTAVGPVVEDEGIATLVGQLVEDARGLASAEVALVKARVGERANAYKNAVIFFAVAGVLALAALIALLVGLILSLATLIGPGLATAAVVLAVLAIAGILALVGKSRLAPAAEVQS
ncbi:phage holin family protein [Sphingomonas sp. RP10(2022)]|uniref:Phage holin family protein n=1 Tax=Sphingomonas liriopis TaxID=2949094 RepID=A0A9X2KPQ8_9SPHN|nr:phage holin family protein [Sphingomonas liriopis]MCP3733796.1 phage holin family protein [Sphingomonas liriopis]